MYLTIEELLALKEQYIEEIYKLQAKIDVVCDLVELAKSKVVETLKTRNYIRNNRKIYQV